MTQTPLNIFDLLMGDLTGGGLAGIVGNTSGTTQDPGLFGDLINSYLSLNSQEENPFNLAKGTAEALSGITGNQFDIQDAKTPENVAEFNRQLMALLPQQTSNMAVNIKDIISQVPVDLEPGKYEIVDSQVKDGVISLEAVNKENPLQTVKLTVPLEDLKIAGNARQNLQTAFGSDVAQSRVALGTENYDNSRLNDILSKLNLKEIKVESANVSKVTTDSSEPLRISITAEGTAGEMMIRGKLDRSRVRAVSTNPVNAGESVKTQGAEAARPVMAGSPSAQPDNDYLQGKLLSGNAKAATNIGTRTMGAEQDLFSSLIDRDNASRKTDTQQLYDTIFGYETAGDEKQTTETSTGKAFRLNLPQNLDSLLKPNGRAVTLQIEPENLGPAKLSLSLSGDKLRARIVVESAPAKAALEANVDRLMSQLSKADIKVDQIQITLSQDNTHNEFLGRQPQWQHRMVNRVSNSDSVLQEQLGTPDIAPIVASREYVGAAGVNVFA